MGQFLFRIFRIFLAQLVHPLWYPLKLSKVLFAGIRRSFKQQFDRQCFQEGTHRIKYLWQKIKGRRDKNHSERISHALFKAFLLCTARKNGKRKLYRIINIVFVVGNRDTRWIDAGAKGVFFFFLLKVTPHCDFRIKTVTFNKLCTFKM